jgi:hypothetical protein
MSLDERLQELDTELKPVRYPSGEKYADEIVIKGKKQATQAILKDLLDMLDIVEPCEPDCDKVRHARHQGQWEMHLKQAEAVRKYCE